MVIRQIKCQHLVKRLCLPAIIVGLFAVSIFGYSPKIDAAPGNSSFTNSNFYLCILNELDSINAKKSIGDPDGYSGRTTIGESYIANDYELGQVTELHCAGYGDTANIRISDSAGIAKMPNLAEFDFDFSDRNFYSCVIRDLNSEHVNGVSDRDAVNNTYIATDSELSKLRVLYCNDYGKTLEQKIHSLDGLTKLTGLYTIQLVNTHISSIDTSKSPLLKTLIIQDGNDKIGDNSIQEINLSNNKALTILATSDNLLSSIDLRENTNLTTINLSGNALKGIFLPASESLTQLYLSDNQLNVDIDFSNNSALEVLFIDDNPLTKTPNLSNNLNLETVDLSNNLLTTPPNLAKCVRLTQLDLSNNKLEDTPDLSTNIKLNGLNLYNNKLKDTPDLTFNTMLTFLDLGYNQFTGKINLTKNSSLTDIRLYKNQLTEINVGNNTSIRTLSVHTNPLLTNLIFNIAIVDKINIEQTPILKYFTLVFGDERKSKIKINTSSIIETQPNTLISDTLAVNAFGMITAKRFAKNYISHALNNSSNEILTSGLIKTNDKLKLNDVDDYPLAVLGDVAADGQIMINDVSKLFNYYKGATPLEGAAFLEAGDVTDDDKIMINDVAKLFNYYKGAINSL